MSKQYNIFPIDLEKQLNFNKQLLSDYVHLNVQEISYVVKKLAKTISKKIDDYEKINFTIIL